MDDEEREVSIVETEDVEDTLQETIGTFARKQICVWKSLYIFYSYIFISSAIDIVKKRKRNLY